jgi:ketosteroid isomerase-like protein
MASDNLEVARRAVEAFNRRDMTNFVECFDEEVVWVPLRDVPDLTEPAHGHEGMLEMLNRWLEPWDQYDSLTHELIGEGDVAMWTTHVVASHDASGMRLDRDIYAVLAFRNGKIVLARWFWERDEAVDALTAGDLEKELAALRGTRGSPRRPAESL